MKRRRTGQCGFFDLHPFIKVTVCAAAACSILSGALLAFFSPEARAKTSPRTLGFQERVAYQRAIEDVYWRHRIWPKENPDPKPSLDAVISQAQLEQKVEDYLRKSQALEDWQRPITAEQLQTEMNRMAKHTKQPEVLRELFKALGNDPSVIAECLARPTLAERLVTNFSTNDRDQLDPSRAKAGNQMPKPVAAASASYELPTISDVPNGCADDTWTPTSITNAPSDRRNHTAVWTGSEMIVWGGFNGSGMNTGGRYNPSTDSWAATSTTNAPAAREAHTAVWTGSQMIVWGGLGSGFTYFNVGGRYNPVTNNWSATTTTNAPTGRDAHTAIWTGSEMIVWGGYYWDGIDHYLNTGGKYNPTIDSWTGTTAVTAPSARAGHTGVWTGNEMIIWGGYGCNGPCLLNTGGRYNPSTDSWTATTTTNAPSARATSDYVWTGSEMIVWGGTNDSTGGRYNPSTDNWTPTSIINAPDPGGYTAVWTGSEMILWGEVAGNPNYFNTDEAHSAQFAPSTPNPTNTPTPTATVTATPAPSPGTGGRYAPATDSWRATSTMNAPNARFGHTAVWTGSEMIVWGGGAPYNTNSGGRYCAQPSATPTPTATATTTPTATATATPTSTLTPTVTPTTTARPAPVPRVRPTPAPRP